MQINQRSEHWLGLRSLIAGSKVTKSCRVAKQIAAAVHEVVIKF